MAAIQRVPESTASRFLLAGLAVISGPTTELARVADEACSEGEEEPSDDSSILPGAVPLPLAAQTAAPAANSTSS